jgi:hypothetical protein
MNKLSMYFYTNETLAGELMKWILLGYDIYHII